MNSESPEKKIEELKYHKKVIERYLYEYQGQYNFLQKYVWIGSYHNYFVQIFAPIYGIGEWEKLLINNDTLKGVMKRIPGSLPKI